MFCFLALIIFSLLGIFSATHRALAKQALACVLKRMTFRPCDADFKTKIKNKILMKLLDRSETAARIFYKHFELLSWIFFILMIASSFWIVKGGYNFYLYGSCNGLNQSGFCAFDPRGENNKITALNSAGMCGSNSQNEKKLTLEKADLSKFPSINSGSKNTMVFIGCYECEYSKKAYAEIRELAKKEKTDLIFAHYPAIADTYYLSEIAYCAYNQNKEKFWNLNDYLFASDKTKIQNHDFIIRALEEFGFSSSEIIACADSSETKTEVEKQSKEIKKTGTYGTPTVFINSEIFIGPKPYRVYKSAIKKFILF